MKELVEEIREFVREREWEHLRNPKNVVMALSVEVAEIVEIFQWMTEQNSTQLDPQQLLHLEHEIGDVMIQLTDLADKFGLDPIAAAKKKVELNAQKYPVSLVRKSKKAESYKS